MQLGAGEPRAVFQIKICGITRVDDARQAVEAGADACGLNFYLQSPRFVGLSAAAEICRHLSRSVVRVGVFVNAPPSEVIETFDRLALDLIQLHGDEPPEYAAQLGGRPVVRAFRLGPEGIAAIERYLARAEALGVLPRMVLVDAYRAGQYGGTGNQADWDALAGYAQLPWKLPLVLAGGLGPDNVAEAIGRVRPAAVDTASGVETAPGQKSAERMRRFVAAARAAFSAR